MFHFALVAVLLCTLLPQPSSGDGFLLGEPILRDKFINPRDQIVDRGAKVNLTCRPLHNDFQFQIWSFIDEDGQPYEVNADLPQRGYTLEGISQDGKVTTNLIIDSVEDRHETYYQCVARNGSEAYYSAGAQVIIFEQADVKFHKDTPISDKVFTAQAGSPATLSIEVSGKPSPLLTLQKQAGSTWTKVTDERFIVNASQIYVSYVKMGDSRKYQLIVNNTVDRRISLLFEIRVEGGGWTSKMIDSALEKRNVASSVCPGVSCPVPPCANPKYEANSCCPTCKQSACMFSGCVEYSASRVGLGSKWHPDTCTSCYCITDEPICIRTHCPTLQCPKYQIVHRQGECCASCDYSRLNQELCEVVVDEMVNITIQDNKDGVLREVRGKGKDGLCSLKVVKHRCSRDLFRHNHFLYSCQPQSRKRQINVGNVCGLERARIAFKDVVKCSAKPMFQSSEGGDTDHSNEYCNMYFPIATKP